MNKKNIKAVLDSRHIKVLSVKKDELKDSIVFVFLDEDKYGYYDIAQLRKLAEGLEKIEPSGCYFLGVKKLKFNVYEKSEFKNKDIIITVSHPADVVVDEGELEASFNQAFGEARSIKFVHHFAESIE